MASTLGNHLQTFSNTFAAWREAGLVWMGVNEVIKVRGLYVLASKTPSSHKHEMRIRGDYGDYGDYDNYGDYMVGYAFLCSKPSHIYSTMWWMYGHRILNSIHEGNHHCPHSVT